LAHQVFGGRGAVGTYVLTTINGIGPLSRRLVSGREYEVVGVVKDIKNSSLRTAAEPAIYFAER
jgi:hypothetical protein